MEVELERSGDRTRVGDELDKKKESRKIWAFNFNSWMDVNIF